MQAYAHEIIGDLNNWVEAITDWNMIVDENGGPYHNRGDGVKGSVVVNHTSGEYKIGYLYYSFAHFSKVYLFCFVFFFF
jgi:glucosylceramidase